MCTSPDDIRNVWGSYYKELYDNKRDGEYNESFNIQVQTELEAISEYEKYPVEYGRFRVDQVRKHVMKLKNKKVPGWDTISAEHLKNLGPKASAVVTWLLIVNNTKQNRRVRKNTTALQKRSVSTNS